MSTSHVTTPHPPRPATARSPHSTSHTVNPDADHNAAPTSNDLPSPPSPKPTASSRGPESVTESSTPAPDTADTTDATNPTTTEPPAAPHRATASKFDQPPAGFWTRLFHKLEARISALSTRNNFWHRICSWIWLPLAYRSGIKFNRGDESTFSAILPFRKFNKNWYNAMAGGALLGNAEVAGGMYVFKKCGADYTVVCKHLEYTFRRPCHGPAVYRVEPRENIEALVATRGEFNITVDMTIVQMVRKPGERERRVGHCTATFHITPKTQHRLRKFRRQQRDMNE